MANKRNNKWILLHCCNSLLSIVCKQYIKYLLVGVALILSISSCRPLHKIPPGSYLLDKNKVEAGRTTNKEEIAEILKQKPNRKVLGLFRFHLSVYLYASTKNDNKVNKWLRNTVGEAPSLYDSILTYRSKEQIKFYMRRHGYYDAEVTDTVIVHRSKPKVEVVYRIKENTPFTIEAYELTTVDSSLQPLLNATLSQTIIKIGALLNAEKIEEEKERITKLMKNNGYFDFSNYYIEVTGDTSLGNHKMKVFFTVINPEVVSANGDTLRTHEKYMIDRVSVYTSFDPLSNDSAQNFTRGVEYHGLYFNHKPDLYLYKPRVISNHIFIEPGKMFNNSVQENTYNRLGDMGIFRFINIKYTYLRKDTNGINHLGCGIFLTPSKRKTYSINNELTHNGGNIGVAGYVSFRNNNAFKNGEIFEVRLRGSLETTPQLADIDKNNQNTGILFFNTIDFGPEINLSFREFLFPFSKKLNKGKRDIYTTLGTKFNYESRLEFTRSLAAFSYTYHFRNIRNLNIEWALAEINYLDAKLQPEFEQLLFQQGGNALLISYTSQLISAGRLSMVYSDRNKVRSNSAWYYRLNTEFAGTTLWIADLYSNKKKNSSNQYEIFSVPYTNYLRPDGDIRYYRFFKGNNSLVLRLAGGVGFSYWNSRRLPFEKSFFAGGSNDHRGWRARRLGPGSYTGEESFKKIGDIKLNGNFEYRFDILKIIEGAAFIDAGNIWNLRKLKDFPGAQFKADTFIDEIAISSGLGLRVNFNFF
ncbi:MAG: BamA/TamA family outer membrane protein [Bacteroidetes bacterium]|nr:BamA/TamA family outer membrane protein [Bacteroidota bacterium]